MIGIKSAALLALIGLGFPGASWLHAEDRMRAGMWEVTSTSTGKEKAVTNTCYTPAMVASTNLPAKEYKESTEKLNTLHGCTISDFTIEAGKMSMTKVCNGTSTVFSSTYGGDVFDTVIKTTRAGATEVIRMTGRRIGACK